MVLIGNVGAHLSGENRIFSIIGATAASFTCFILLCYGARHLVPYFQKPKVWRMFNVFVVITMWGIALTLILTE